MGSASEKDYFGSFLSAAADGPSIPPLGAPSFAPGVEKQILGFLAPKEEPVSVRQLLVELEISPSLAIMAIHHLSDAKLIDLRQIDGDECIAMTELGRRIAA